MTYTFHSVTSFLHIHNITFYEVYQVFVHSKSLCLNFHTLSSFHISFFPVLISVMFVLCIKHFILALLYFLGGMLDPPWKVLLGLLLVTFSFLLSHVFLWPTYTTLVTTTQFFINHSCILNSRWKLTCCFSCCRSLVFLSASSGVTNLFCSPSIPKVHINKFQPVPMCVGKYTPLMDRLYPHDPISTYAISAPALLIDRPCPVPGPALTSLDINLSSPYRFHLSPAKVSRRGHRHRSTNHPTTNPVYLQIAVRHLVQLIYQSDL